MTESKIPTAFETLRFTANQARYWSDHWTRLQHSLQVLKITPSANFTRAKVEDALKLLISEKNWPEARLKLWVNARTWQWEIKPFRPDESVWETGARVKIEKVVRHTPRAKYETGLYQRLAHPDFFETLLETPEQQITEGNITNVFIQTAHGALKTPDQDMLPGIMRQKVLDWIQSQPLSLELGSITRSEIKQAKSVFLTNALRGIVPVGQLEETSWYLASFALAKKIKTDLAV